MWNAVPLQIVKFYCILVVIGSIQLLFHFCTANGLGEEVMFKWVEANSLPSTKLQKCELLHHKQQCGWQTGDKSCL